MSKLSSVHASKLTADISHNIIADHERSGNEEPHVPLEDVVDDEVTVISTLAQDLNNPFTLRPRSKAM
jgi:hypothetical protein